MNYFLQYNIFKHSPQSVKHRILCSLNNWIRFSVTSTTEVIVVDRPEHNSSQSISHYILTFLAGNLLVVIANPLVISERIRSHCIGIGLHNSPVILVLDALADLRNFGEYNYFELTTKYKNFTPHSKPNNPFREWHLPVLRVRPSEIQFQWPHYSAECMIVHRLEFQEPAYLDLRLLSDSI